MWQGLTHTCEISEWTNEWTKEFWTLGEFASSHACIPTWLHNCRGWQWRLVKETQEDSPAQGAQAPFHQPLGIHLRPGLCTLPQPYFSSPPGSKDTSEVYPCPWRWAREALKGQWRLFQEVLARTGPWALWGWKRMIECIVVNNLKSSNFYRVLLIGRLPKWH